jgi:hypothetical protein
VDESPGLRIEDVRFRSLVVIRRAIVDGKEVLQRKQLFRSQYLQAFLRKSSDIGGVIIDIDGCKVFGQTFVQPRETGLQLAAEEIMRQFVIDDVGQVAVSIRR